MHSHAVVFFHVLSAIIWIGGMIAIRVAVHPILQSLDAPTLKLGKTLEVTGRLFHLVIPFILTLLATGIMMVLAADGHHGSLRTLYLTKEAIWTLMALNFGYMYLQRATAWKLFQAGELPEAKAKVRLIPNLLLPINIALGIVALYLGVSLRGL